MTPRVVSLFTVIEELHQDIHGGLYSGDTGFVSSYTFQCVFVSGYNVICNMCTSCMFKMWASPVHMLAVKGWVCCRVLR